MRMRSRKSAGAVAEADRRVVVARRDDDGRDRGQPRQRPLEELHRLDGRHAPVVDVARDEHGVDGHAVGRVLDELADAVEHSRLRLVEVHAVERAPEVPVGGVEQPHATTVGPRADTLPADTPTAPARRRARRGASQPRPSVLGSYRDRMDQATRRRLQRGQHRRAGRRLRHRPVPLLPPGLPLAQRRDPHGQHDRPRLRAARARRRPAAHPPAARAPARRARLRVLVTEPRPLLVVPDSSGAVRVLDPRARPAVVPRCRRARLPQHPGRLPPLPRPPRHRAARGGRTTASTSPTPSTRLARPTACARSAPTAAARSTAPCSRPGWSTRSRSCSTRSSRATRMASASSRCRTRAAPGGIRLRLEEVERLPDGALCCATRPPPTPVCREPALHVEGGLTAYRSRAVELSRRS